MIVEPVMMNAGIIPPDDGYLAASRDLLHAHGALLTFDEVKTGFTTGPGGRHRDVRRRRPTSSVWPRLRRRHRVGRDRGHRRGDGADRRRPLRAGRHVQRQPAGDGGDPGHPVRGAHPGGLRASGRGWRARLRRRSGSDHRRARLRLARGGGRGQGLRDVPRDRVREYRDFLEHRRPARPPALADPAQRRRLPAAVGQGRAVAAVRSARRGRRRPLRRATSPVGRAVAG